MLLYHGSDKIIRAPKIDGGRIHNDYGQGFYCTKHVELAKEWAVSDVKDGFVNSYELDDTNLNIINLNNGDYSILHWLTLLLDNRTLKTSNAIAIDGLEYLKNNYYVDISDYDVVIGYRADDSYFKFARAFLSNSISIAQLEQSMHLGELGLQYFIRSQKAFEQIRFIDATAVDHRIYYPLKSGRDTNARNEYMRITQNMHKDGVYLIDLMRKES